MVETQDLIDSIVTEVRPVRRLWPPLLRAGIWTGLAVSVICLLGIEHGLRPDFPEKLRSASFITAVVASLATGVLAACGCLMASLPDRSRAWLLLPLPTAAVWVSTIGYGCLTDWVDFTSGGVQMGEAVRCFATLMLVSLPLSIAMFAMLRHAARLRPASVTLTAGLAVAALTSTALALFHRLDATIMILLWNLGTAVVIVALEAAFGTRMLAWFDRAAPR